MTVSIEIDGTIKFRDTSGFGDILGPRLTASLTVVEQCRGGPATLVSGGTHTVPFGSVTASKFLAIYSSVLATATVTINGVSNVCEFSGTNVWQNSSGHITAATVTQSTGADSVVESMVAGST